LVNVNAPVLLLYAREPNPVPELAALSDESSATVPPASGKTIERSAVGFVTETTVSFASAPDPSNVMPELSSFKLFAASAAPTFKVVLATKVVDVRDVSPAIVVAVAPNPIVVEPTVSEELASEDVGMLAVPNSPVELSYVKPEPDATDTCPRTSLADGPVYVITPEVEL
jgi:hypothetical protein